MRKPALLAVVFGLALPAYSHAEDVVLKFGQRSKRVRPSQYQQEAVKSFEAEIDIKVEVTTVPYPEYRAARWLAPRCRAAAPDVSTIDLGRGVRRCGGRHPAAR